MGNSAYNRLVYAGNAYDIFIGVYSPSDKSDYTNVNNYYNIPISFVNRFEIQSSISSPLMSGYIKFVTKGTNPFQTIFREMCSYLYVNINLVNVTGNIESVKNDYIFEHIFLVTNVNITNVSKNLIEYEVSFVSSHWWNFENIIYVTTSGIKKNVIDILIESFNKAGLKFDKMNENPSNRSIIYTSSHNDSLKTIAPYLLSKSLDPHEDINVEEFKLYAYIYNHINDNYELWSLANVINKIHELYKNGDKENNEHVLDLITVTLRNDNPLITPTDPNIEIYQTSTFNRLDVYKGIASTNFYNFDFSQNKFDKYTLEDTNKTKIIDSQWHNFLSDIFKLKYIKIKKSSDAAEYPTSTPIDFSKHYSISDSNSLYSSGLNTLLANDSILIKSRCDIRRKPGDIVSLLINEDINVISSESNYSSSYDKSLLKTYDSYYVITDNRMVFEFDENTNKHIFRNYMFLNRPSNLK